MAVDTNLIKNMIVVDPNKEYSLNEIVEEGLIPGVNGYAKIYSLVTVDSADGKGKDLAPQTDKYHLMPIHNKVPGTKINKKIHVSGVEIIRFLKLHDLLNV